MTIKLSRQSVVAMAILLTAVLTVPLTRAAASGSITIRFVAAEQREEASSDHSLRDILPLLKSNLRYNSYRLISSRQAALRDNTQVNLGQGYTLSLGDVEASTVTVRIDRQRDRLVKTRLRLEPDRPVILGGFQQGKDTILIVVISLDAGSDSN